MRRILFILALFLIATGFLFAAPVVDIGESPPVGVICTAAVKSADIIMLPVFFDQAIIYDATTLNIFPCIEPSRLDKDYLLYNPQRKVESETIFAYY